MSIWNLVSGKSATEENGEKAAEERPIRFIQDGNNSWRIVYAD